MNVNLKFSGDTRYPHLTVDKVASLKASDVDAQITPSFFEPTSTEAIAKLTVKSEDGRVLDEAFLYVNGGTGKLKLRALTESRVVAKADRPASEPEKISDGEKL